jgi:hypothetical protein
VDVALANLAHLLSDGEVCASVEHDSTTDAGSAADEQQHSAGNRLSPRQDGDAPSE